MNTEVNVAPAERWTSSLAGAGLAALALKQLKDDNPFAAAALSTAGALLIYRGATGHCPAYAATGINTNARDSTREYLGGSGGVNVDEVVTINRSAEDLYDVWRDFTQLPMFMENLVSVRKLDTRRSHWVAKAPAGQTVEWDAEIINEIPNSLIAWRTLPNSNVISAGSVHFKRAPGNRGTEVRVRMQYAPPAGKVGSALAWLFGQEPSQTIQEDLRRFKQLMEGREMPTTEGQPRGAR
jgi:uncharacterized membrane protein